MDLCALARRCAERLEVEAARRGVTVAVRGAEVSAMGSEALIEEMLMNLCDNAIKYNREGGRVVITTGEREGFPCFSVEDNGIGIAPEHLGGCSNGSTAWTRAAPRTRGAPAGALHSQARRGLAQGQHRGGERARQGDAHNHSF